MSTYLSVPNPGDILGSQSQPQIKANFDYITATLGKDHQIATGDSSATTFEGRHKTVSFNNQSTASLAMPGDGTNAVMWSNNGDLYVRNATAAFTGARLTGPVATTANANTRFGTNTNYTGALNGGWTFLPGGLVLQYGSSSSIATSTTTITFPIPFPNAVFSITATWYRNSSSSPGDVGIYVVSASTTTSSFVLKNNGAHAIDGVYWMAVGN